MFWRVKFVDVDQLCFQTAEPPLNHNVVCPAGFSIHALTNVKVSQKLLVLITGELTSLVRIQDSGGAKAVYRLPDCLQYRGGIQRIRQFPSHDLSAVLINNGCQVHMPMVHFDVGDIN